MTFGILLVRTTNIGLSDGCHVWLVSLSLAAACLVEHHLSFRDTMFWFSTGVLFNDEARD